MRANRHGPNAGFTLLELIIGMSLGLMVLAAVLSSYVFLARNFTRSLGISSANEPPLEGQSRRALASFTQEVRMASGITGTASATEVTLVLPGSTGTKNITYYYNSSSTTAVVYGVSTKPNSLTRIDRSNSTGLTLQSNILACSISYYDVAGNPYTTYVNYLSGVKWLNLSYTTQVGSSANGTLTPVFQFTSAPLLLRNKSLLY